ncbi:YadA family autotransporter adhesin, partial [Gallibacterium genomosp. 3]
YLGQPQKQYNFAGRGEKGGGVMSVGGIIPERDATTGIYQNVSYGRIIQNVAPGLIGANSTDAINGSQLYVIYEAINKDLERLKNLTGSSFVLKTNNGQGNPIKLGDTVRVVDGANTKVSTITSNKKGDEYTYSINVDGLPMAFKDTNGAPLVKVGDTFYKASDIGSDGKLSSDAQEAIPTAVTLLDKDGNPTVQKLEGIKSSISDVTDPNNTSLTFTEKLELAAKDENRKNAAVNVSDLNEVAKAAANAKTTADKGFNVKTSATDDGVVDNKGISKSGDIIKPGESLTFIAGHDIAITQEKGTITIAANTQAIVNDSQLPTVYTITDDNGQIVKVYKVGNKFYYDVAGAKPVGTDVSKIMVSVQGADGDMNKAAKLGNVADGRIERGSKEAVNGGQLFGLQEYLGVTLINNDNHVDNSTTTVNQLNPVEIKEYSFINEKNEKVTVRVPLDEQNKPYLKTYNVNNNGEYITNNIYSAIRNINEQGTKYFHVNAGQDIPEAQITNSDDSSASAIFSTAIGYQSNVGSGASHSLAVGTQNEIGKDAANAVAIGSSATVIQDSDNAIAIGKDGTVAGNNTISVGTGHIVAGDNSGAIGDPTTINAKSSYSVGNNNSIGDEAVIDEIEKAIKERKELKRPDPLPALEANPTDEQLKDYQAKLAKYQTELADYLKKKEALAAKIKDLSAQVTTENVMAMGNEIKVGAKANNAVAVGTKVTIDAEASDAVAMGTSAHVKASNGVAIGNSAVAEAKNGVAIGNNAKAVTENSIALGANAEAKQTLEQLQSAVPWGNLANVRGYGKEVIGEVSVGRTTEDGKQEVRRITNVAAGSAPTDAVNVSQLYGLGSDMSKQLGRLNQRVGKLARDLEGVGATSAAMASLPQAYIPGKSLVAVSVGSHKSAQAVAIGVSRISDNGKIILKLNAGHNTVGDTSVGAGVGFQF